MRYFPLVSFLIKVCKMLKVIVRIYEEFILLKPTKSRRNEVLLSQ